MATLLLAIAQGRNAVSKRQQRLVDLIGLLQHLAVCLCVFDALGTGQILQEFQT